jgi:NADPH:quinone reductase-like Zn-dependent oxidoreductase
VAALVESGSLRPLVHPGTFEPAEVADAHDALASRTAPGKVVVTIGR